MTPQKLAWQRKRRKFYEEAVNILKTEYLPLWRDWGFQVQTAEELNKFIVTVATNGEHIRTLIVQLNDVSESTKQPCLEFIREPFNFRSAIDRLPRDERKGYKRCIDEYDAFTETIVYWAAFKILSNHFGETDHQHYQFYIERNLSNLHFLFRRDEQIWSWRVITRSGKIFSIKRPLTEKPLSEENLIKFLAGITLQLAI